MVDSDNAGPPRATVDELREAKAETSKSHAAARLLQTAPQEVGGVTTKDGNQGNLDAPRRRPFHVGLTAEPDASCPLSAA
jgi:hypothetical protein